jgi:D-3-phosphoglycerate dehydrogenase
MENAIFSGGTAAVCTLKLDQEPSDKMMKEIRRNPDIIQASLT